MHPDDDLSILDTHPPIVLESSANLTSNDNRLEQYAITCSNTLATFHLEWMDEIFSYHAGKLPRNAFPGDARLAHDKATP